MQEDIHRNPAGQNSLLKAKRFRSTVLAVKASAMDQQAFSSARSAARETVAMHRHHVLETLVQLLWSQYPSERAVGVVIAFDIVPFADIDVSMESPAMCELGRAALRYAAQATYERGT